MGLVGLIGFLGSLLVYKENFSRRPSFGPLVFLIFLHPVLEVAGREKVA